MIAKKWQILVGSATMSLFMLGPAHAQNAECKRLWVERNAIFHDAGYCFGSRLGRAVFNNHNCFTKKPRLSNSVDRRVKRILARERRLGCKRLRKGWRAGELRSIHSSLYGGRQLSSPSQFGQQRQQPVQQQPYQQSPNQLFGGPAQATQQPFGQSPNTQFGQPNQAVQQPQQQSPNTLFSGPGQAAQQPPQQSPNALFAQPNQAAPPSAQQSPNALFAAPAQGNLQPANPNFGVSGQNAAPLQQSGQSSLDIYSAEPETIQPTPSDQPKEPFGATKPAPQAPATVPASTAQPSPPTTEDNVGSLFGPSNGSGEPNLPVNGQSAGSAPAASSGLDIYTPD